MLKSSTKSTRLSIGPTTPKRARMTAELHMHPDFRSGSMRIRFYDLDVCSRRTNSFGGPVREYNKVEVLLNRKSFSRKCASLTASRGFPSYGCSQGREDRSKFVSIFSRSSIARFELNTTQLAVIFKLD